MAIERIKIGRIGIGNSRHGYGGMNFKCVDPQRYLKRICGFDILKGELSVHHLSRMMLQDLAKVKKMGNESASRVISASMLFVEGVDVPRANFDRMVDKLSALLLHGPEIFYDQCYVADLAYLIGKRMGLPEGRLKNLRLAGLLHDIGKAAGEGAEHRRVEAASSKVQGSYNPPFVGITVARAFIKLFSVRDVVDPEMSLHDYAHKFFLSSEADEILETLAGGLKLNTGQNGISIGTFFRLHNYWSTEFLKDKIDERPWRMIAMHHILEGVNPLDPQMFPVELRMEHVEGYDVHKSVGDEVARAKKDEAFWSDVKILILADKFDALLRRTKMPFNRALERFHAIVRANHFVEETEFKKFTNALYKMIQERDPGLVLLGIID